MKQILVPVDLSGLSEKAWRLAADVASKLQMGVTLLHVIPASGEVLVDVTGNLIDSEDFDTSEISMKMQESALKLEEWKKLFPGLSVSALARPGQAEEVILNEVKKNSYELLVMATHGATGMKEFFVGSHTEHIAMKSTVPVLSIKDTEKDISRVVFASSFSGVMPVPSMLPALCKALNAHVTFLHIKTPSDASRDLEITQNMDLTASKCGITVSEKVILPMG
jgi:nucleotide-binding universal stress UspA family protein